MNLVPNFLRRLGAKPTPTLSDAARVMGQRACAKRRDAERTKVFDKCDEMAAKLGRPPVYRRQA